MNSKYVFRIPTEPEIQIFSSVFMKGLKSERNIMAASFTVISIFTLCFLVGLFENIRTNEDFIKALPIFALSVLFLSIAIILFKGMYRKIKVVSDVKDGAFGVMDCICTDVQLMNIKGDLTCPAARIYPIGYPDKISEKLYPVQDGRVESCQELENRVAWLVRIERSKKEYLCINRALKDISRSCQNNRR